MKQIKVEITGESDLLMNSPKGMIEKAEGEVTAKTSGKNIKADAESVAYRMDNKELYVPSEAIKGTLINASAYKKIGKYALRPIIAGGVTIEPEQISLKTKTYDIDLRTVVIQRARVVKARPRIKNWKISFILNYDETLIPNPEELLPILEEAGKRIGILDFRPAKNGSFGKFKVTKWDKC